MPTYRVSGEVIGAFMHLLHERCVCIDQTAWLEYAVNLRHNNGRVKHMFQNRLNPHTVEALVDKGKLVSIGHHFCVTRYVDIGPNQVDRLVVIEIVSPVAYRTSANHKNARRCIVRLELSKKPGTACPGHRIRSEEQLQDPRPEASSIIVSDLVGLSTPSQEILPGKYAFGKIDEHRLASQYQETFLRVSALPV